MTTKHAKNNILIINTGGTFGFKPNKEGGLAVIDKNILATKKFQDILARYNYEVISLTPIDSTNMSTPYRAEIAKIIHENSQKFDGFVVLHGTDTMVHTAAALNYMLNGGFGKPIVLTGSQISGYERRTDATTNFIAALELATMDIGEIVIAFGNDVIKGVRAIKFSENKFDAFKTFRYSSIGCIGIKIQLSDQQIKRYSGISSLFTGFDTHIAYFVPASGVEPNIFLEVVENPDIHGILMVGYGAGNIPNIYYLGIEKAIKMHKPVLILTECLEGTAEMGLYEAGCTPLKLGGISGYDMTPSAAVQKLMFALGLANTNNIEPAKRIEYVRNVIHTPINEDITPMK